MIPLVEKHINTTVEDIAFLKPATSSSPFDRDDLITKGGRFWYTNETDTAWVEIDLQGTFAIDRVEIDWDGKASKRNVAGYNVSAEINGHFIKVRDNADEQSGDRRA